MSTTATATNLETVQALYEAFGRGDVEAILGMVSEDAQWEPWADNSSQHADVPWFKQRSGHEGVAEFFQIVGQFKIAEFSVLDIMAGERQVAAEIVIDAEVPGGGRYRDEEMHLWSFDADGKINRLRHYTDTAKHIAAAGGKDTTKR